MNTKRRMRPSTIITILALLFLIPIITAWAMFKGNHIFGLMNHGRLIKPPFSASLLKLKNQKGKQIIEKKWTLVYFNPGLCDKTCQEGLYHLRQIRIATGDNMKRVARVLLTYPSELANNTSLQLILTERFPGTEHLTVKEQNFADVVRQHVKTDYALESGTIYLIDPQGNVMMTYKPGTKPNSIYKDLKRLLKVSQVG